MSLLKIVNQESNRPLSKGGCVLAVAAGKGGVGKSTVAVQLALRLKDLGYKVGLIDADIYGPSMGQMLPPGMEPVEDESHPEKMLPALSLGLFYISVAHFRKNASIVRAPVANQIIEQFLETVSWPKCDYLIIDFPPGTGDIQLTLMQKAPIDGAIVVTTPQLVSMIDVRKATQLFKRMEIPVLGVIENMSYFLSPQTNEKLRVFGIGAAAELTKEFNVPLLGEIPLDPEVSLAADESRELKKGSLGQKSFEEITDKILEAVTRLPKGGNQVRQRGAHHLELLGEEGVKSLSLHRIQEKCPCARCQGQGKSVEDVSLLEFSYIGRYAIRITFSSGCSQGIYPFSLLKVL